MLLRSAFLFAGLLFFESSRLSRLEAAERSTPSPLSLAAPQASASRLALSREDSIRLEQRTSAVAAELRCPVCQGLSIQDSPSELALEMRSVVRDQLAAGRSPDEVKRYFVDKYGEWILLQPRPSGFNVLVYILPVAAVFAGIAVIALAVRRWTRPAPG